MTAASKQIPLNFSNKYVSATWAARAIGVSITTVYRLIEDGSLISKQLTPEGWHRISYDSVVKLMQTLDNSGGNL